MSDTRNRTTKITKHTLATEAAAPATPPKPKIPAISATTKNVNAQLNISIPFLCSPFACAARRIPSDSGHSPGHPSLSRGHANRVRSRSWSIAPPVLTNYRHSPFLDSDGRRADCTIRVRSARPRRAASTGKASRFLRNEPIPRWHHPCNRQDNAQARSDKAGNNQFQHHEQTKILRHLGHCKREVQTRLGPDDGQRPSLPRRPGTGIHRPDAALRRTSP
jgi:hypothetical protein